MVSRGGDVLGFEAQAMDIESCILDATTKSEALNRHVVAAELYLKALRQATSQNEKIRFRGKCNTLLEQAERIRAMDDWQPNDRRPNSAELEQALGQGPVTVLIEPLSTRPLTTREKIILLEGSKLNGFVFPPWQSAPDPSEFELGHGEDRFIDLPELGLSPLQLEIFDGWKRPEDITALVNEQSEAPSSFKMDLVQDITTDCSVVASLCAGTARAEKGHPRMISSVVYPYDWAQMMPIKSRNGKYIFRLHFNGCFRKVLVDDRLPSSRTTRTLHVVDRNNPALLWPALLEKAYLKVRGGYDFPGSNSGTDIWVLMGWIPEQVFLRSDDTLASQLWRRIFRSFNYGDVLITIGTGSISKNEEKTLGLASQHDYAVLDMKEFGEHRLLLVKNPWAEGTIWRGHPALRTMPGADPDDDDAIRWTTEIRNALPPYTDLLSPGTFWISLNNVMQYFESIYLNWNPGLFTHRQDIHFSWDLSTSSYSAGCFSSNPQYAITNKTGGSVWVLLSRHFKTGEDMAKVSPASPGVGKGQPGFISIYAFNNGGQRVFLGDGALYRGPFVDSPQTLLRLNMPPSTTYTIAISEESLSITSHNFTLSAFSLEPIGLMPAAEMYAHRSLHHAAWTPSTAGGNAGCSSYPTNPQFSIQLEKPSDLALLLETRNPDLPVHVRLVWAGGKRVTALTTRDIVGESGDYRRGCALAELRKVDAGCYTIVCSTFQSGQLGRFGLRVGSTVECTVKPLLAEEAGRLRFKLEPAVFTKGLNRLLSPLMTYRLTKVQAVARYSSPSSLVKAFPRSPLRISFELGQGPNKKALTTSGNGEFNDAPMGLRTRDVDLHSNMAKRGGVWVVLERLGDSDSWEEELVEVELLSEGPLDVGKWGIGTG